MTTPTHVAVNLVAFLALMYVPTIDPNYTDLMLLVGSNLIDLDHLLTRPIYDPKRNSFTSHPLHKHWMLVSLASMVMLFIRPISFLGIGLLLHFFLDYLYNKRERIQ
ncbi:MAG TPA: DUF6122 family protein [Candidatus Paceibacterota bacterium]